MASIQNSIDDWFANRSYTIFTVTIAAPGVVTADAHGLKSDDKVVLYTTSALPTGLSAETWYYVIYVDNNSFKLSATRSGSAITTTGSQSGSQYYATNLMPRMIPFFEDNE